MKIVGWKPMFWGVIEGFSDPKHMKNAIEKHQKRIKTIKEKENKKFRPLQEQYFLSWISIYFINPVTARRVRGGPLRAPRARWESFSERSWAMQTPGSNSKIRNQSRGMPLHISAISEFKFPYL